MLALGVALLALIPPQGPKLDAATPRPTSARVSERLELDFEADLLGRADAASNRALSWLAAQQREGGYWAADVGHKQGDGYYLLRSASHDDAIEAGHIGVTALCGMAFLAGGHLPDRGEFGDTMRRCLDYVLAHVSDSGIITDGGTRMYGHAFATLFLAEVHGMVGSKATRAELERAVHIIVDCQNSQGGWRYNAFSTEADMSVTVCQLQALRAARNIGIRVSKSTIDDAISYVLRARITRGPERGLFYYKTAGRGAWQKNREFAINAAALTALFSAGIHDDELHQPTLDWLDREYVTVRTWSDTHYYYWYGNYYACQAFFQAGGDRFRAYQRRLTEDLFSLQQADGRWRNEVGPGDTFSTAVGALILQIPKQYLPIFQR